MCCLEPLPQLNPSFYVKALLELHRQVCPVEQYPNLMILRLSNESLFETILPRIMSDYREYTKTISDQADEYYTYANDYYSCNLIPISHSIELRDARHVTYSIRTIFFYPKWMYKEFHMDPNGTIATAFRSGYEVVYDLDNTMEIFHWNNHSSQTITIDPHNIVVPNEMHDLYGFEIELYLSDIVRKAMPFETYFLEHVANKINGTAYVTELFTGRMSVVPLFGRHIQGSIGIVAGMGTTFWAVTVPRAKPKSIVSVLVDPLDMYTWITYFISVLIMAAVFESGIYDYYYNNVTQINLHYVHDTFVDRVVKVSDLTLLWCVYGCGTLLCVVCFVMEIVIHSESKGL
uniref:Uncharacterized protein n=1 Tax=Anopheles culicifacies TaxID=139723 RepID=A0A182LUQ7_9DIPT